MSTELTLPEYFFHRLKNSEQDSLCARCRVLTFKNFDTEHGFSFFSSLREFIKHFEQLELPCSLCKLVLRSLEVYHNGKTQQRLWKYSTEKAPVQFHVTRTRSGKIAALRVHCSESGPNWFHEFSEDYDAILKDSSKVLGAAIPREWAEEGTLFVIPDPASDPSEKFLLRSPVQHPDSELAIQLLKRWIHNCMNDHAGCRPTCQYPLPTRLIEVNGENLQPRLRLVNREILDKAADEVKYIALSYCWGTNGPYTYVTTPENLKERSEVIEFSSLPQTIRDAISITRSLGQTYLWVDAICILQGSDDAAHADWLSESSRMAEIYGNAYVTIAASQASNVDVGILSPRPPIVRPVVKLSLDGGLEQVSLGLDSDFKFAESLDEPLYSRAWTLQERILSRRVIIYNRDQYVWECQCASWTESGRRMASNGLLRLAEGTAIFSQKKLTELWANIVSDYTARDLTKEKDKLPAIAGLARKFHERIQSPYLAGLWLASIHDDLLWAHTHITIGNRSKRRRPDEWRCPSWSWASLDGNVRWLLGFGNQPRCEVKDHAYVAAGNDEFGGLRDAYLRLRGPLRRIHEVKLRRPYKTQYKNFMPSAETANGFTTSYESDRTIHRNNTEETLHSKRIRLVIMSRFTFRPNNVSLVVEDEEGDEYATSDKLQEKGSVILDMLGIKEIEEINFSYFPEEYKDLWVFQVTARGFLLLREQAGYSSCLIEEDTRIFSRVGIVLCMNEKEEDDLTAAVLEYGSIVEIVLV